MITMLIRPFRCYAIFAAVFLAAMSLSCDHESRFGPSFSQISVTPNPVVSGDIAEIRFTASGNDNDTLSWSASFAEPTDSHLDITSGQTKPNQVVLIRFHAGRPADVPIILSVADYEIPLSSTNKGAEIQDVIVQVVPS